MAGLDIRALTRSDRDWVDALVAEHFSSTRVVSRGVLIETHKLPGWVAISNDEPQGVVLVSRRGQEMEIVVLIAVVPGSGVGRTLLSHVVEQARELRCSRLWLVTTNDNVEAIAFYRMLGWHCVAVHEHAVEAARRIKPEIPLTNAAGVPICDEWEFEYNLY